MSAIELPEIRSHGAGDSIQGLAYFGDREGWHIALSVNRDSEALARSNWEVVTESVLAVPEDTWLPDRLFPRRAPTNSGFEETRVPIHDDGLGDAAIERMSNDLCGWVDHLLVRPGSSAERKALEWLEKLEDYPIADETHYSALEWREEWCVRCDCGTREDHPLYRCRKFRSREDAEEILRRWARNG